MENNCIDVAKITDKKTFILPLMSPDQIDDFVTFLHSGGYDVKKYSEANDNFKRNMYISFLNYTNKSK